MPLHSEDHSSGQAHWQARVLKFVLLTMRRLKKSGYEHPCSEEICYAAECLFPQYYLPNYALSPAIQLLRHTGLIVPDEPNQPATGFRLTQAGQNFDLEQTWQILFGDSAAKIA